MRTSLLGASKRVAEKNRSGGVITGHVHTPHQRLRDALKLGTRFYDGKSLKWQCNDIEMQRHVVRSIAAFVDSVSGDMSQRHLVKDMAADMVGALMWILSCKSEAILCTTANTVLKLIKVMPNSTLQQYALKLVIPLSSLLSSHQLDVSISCAISLNTILSNLSIKREDDNLLIALKETEAVLSLIDNVKRISEGTISIEFFEEMASLLTTILQRFPSSRFPVWNDAKLMQALEVVLVHPDFHAQVTVLKLYSAVALCCKGAEKLLENAAQLLEMIVHCMRSSEPISVRTEAFKLVRLLTADEQGFSKMMSLYCEPIVRSIIHEMSRRSHQCNKLSNETMTLLVEACRLALLVSCKGKHQAYFWKHRIDKVLLDLLLDDFQNGSGQHSLSWEKQRTVARGGLKATYLLALRPYLWDILGWLAIHANEEFDPSIPGHVIDLLITCACLAFMDSMRKCRQILHEDAADDEPVSRTVLMLVYSPNKYISSKARLILSEIMNKNGIENLKHLLQTVNHTSPGEENLGMPNTLQTVVSLIALTCYCGLPEHQSFVIESGGIATLFSLLKRCLKNNVAIGRPSVASHLQFLNDKRTCCQICPEDWEGKDIFLHYGLWGLAELVDSYYHVRASRDMLSGDRNYTETDLVNTLWEILTEISGHGPRWHAAYILSHLGIYGFPSRLGKRIGKAFNEKTYADMQLVLVNGQSLNVHSVLLAARSPSLLPPKGSAPHEKSSDDTYELSDKIQKVVCLSAHVEPEPLTKLLEHIYFGYLQADEEHVKKLKILAKKCKLQPLVRLLSRRRPMWGTLIPRFGLTPPTHGSTLHSFSDIILEAKEAERTSWTCNACSLLVPHVHAHKVILSSGCDYLRAMFMSGMQDSRSQTIKVPVSFEAMVGLVHWLYTNELPDLRFDCLWDSMNTDNRFYKLQPYVELYWLSEFWLFEDIRDACFNTIVSGLKSDRYLSLKVIQMASSLSMWKLAEVAATHMAPLYRELLDSGDLEVLDDMLADMVRAASVQLSHEDSLHSS